VTNGGRLTVATAAALLGTYGLRANVVNRSDMYVADNTPASERSYHARFMFDPNSVSIASGAVHDIFTGLNGAGTVTMRLQITRSSGVFRLRTGTMLDSGSIKYSGWVTISDSPHSLEVAWQAAVGGTGGTQKLYLDGALGASIISLANSSTRIDSVRLGPQALPSGISGVELFDAFTSTRSGYIGPATSAVSATGAAVRPRRIPRQASDLTLS
jgi:hypothetical protein